MCLSCQIQDNSILEKYLSNAQEVDLKTIYQSIASKSQETIDLINNQQTLEK